MSDTPLNEWAARMSEPKPLEWITKEDIIRLTAELASLRLKAARWDEALHRINGNGARSTGDNILIGFSIPRVSPEGLTLTEIVTRGIDVAIAERGAT